MEAVVYHAYCAQWRNKHPGDGFKNALTVIRHDRSTAVQFTIGKDCVQCRNARDVQWKRERCKSNTL